MAPSDRGRARGLPLGRMGTASSGPVVHGFLFVFAGPTPRRRLVGLGQRARMSPKAPTPRRKRRCVRGSSPSKSERPKGEPRCDVPAPEPPTPESFERFAADSLEGPAALPAGCFVALVDGGVVGHTGLAALPTPPHAAENLFTGVRRAWRGRGIATALKQAQIAWARAQGYEWIQTENDELNTSMRGINARLGYKPVAGSILVRGPLS
jgi:RimJ/RimL family protein N-acetyltransferase